MQKGEYRLDLRPLCFRGVRPRILADERGRFAREPRSGVESLRPECQTIENRDAMAARHRAVRRPMASVIKFSLSRLCDLWSRIIGSPSGEGDVIVPGQTLLCIADEGGRMNVSQVRRGFAKRPAAALPPSLVFYS